MNNLEDYPHAFVLASIMDRQTSAEKAWHIPFAIKNILGAFDIDTLSEVSLEEYKQIFDEHKLHRFNEIMADCFYEGVIRIRDVSPDAHVLRIMYRTGLIERPDDRDSVIYKARELYPSYPGIIDYSCWEIGLNWCHPKNPDCKNCIIKRDCKRNI